MGSVAVPSSQRIEPGSHNTPIANWPATAKSTDIDAAAVAKEILDKVNKALSSKDYKALANLFIEDCYWRDHLVNSWDFRTLKGRDAIRTFLEKGCQLEKLEIDDSNAFKAPHVGTFDGVSVKGVEFFTNFVSEVGNGQGVIRVAETDDGWRIFTFFVSLQGLKGHHEPLKHRRVAGVAHGADESRRNWLDRRLDAENFKDHDPAVLIVGAGQGGLICAARLKMLNVPTLIVDMNDRVGDNWRKRYAHLVLHDPIHFNQMPYLSFPTFWPLFTAKDKVAEWFEAYARILELNVWMRSKIEASSYDEEKKQWTVTVLRTKEDGTVESRIMHPRHIIQATGHSGKKDMPQIKGMDQFKGNRLVHSSEFTGAMENCKGKKAVVVGACNSSHDICQDFYEKGYDVTMVQRSSTCIVSSKAITDIGLKGLYDDDGPPTEDADNFLFSMPGEVLKALQLNVAAVQRDFDRETLEGLKKAGFNVDNGPDEAGLFLKYFQRGGGYYIDVGGSQLIVDGKIKVKSGQEIEEVLPHGLKFADGSELEADEIIFATGYQNMRTEARTIFGDDVYNRVQSIWGLDEEGEFRTLWRNSGHPRFYFMGGNFALCRYYSRLLALQIKAQEEGLY